MQLSEPGLIGLSGLKDFWNEVFRIFRLTFLKSINPENSFNPVAGHCSDYIRYYIVSCIKFFVMKIDGFCFF